jgi:alkylation response protein AidB-like acyl-CoA dehydrogenase
MRRLGCRIPLKSFGIWMLGPVLLKYGTEAQKREHLIPIARGEIRWCQGYSEPGAGSDLASLACRAERVGDEYVVTGQKVWTSHADKADYQFCLVRTDPTVPKHQGISFLLIDMTSPGVTVRPIQLISGYSPFCETFFDGVRVPAKDLVGPENGGWEVAKLLLAHERSLISTLRDSASSEEESLESLAMRFGRTENGRLADASLRDRITQASMDFLCNKLTLKRSQEAIAAGRGPGPESSMFKLYGTELNKRRRELKVLICGYEGLGWEGDGYAPEALQYTRDWLRSRANSIEGGSSEIQLNIIAKRVLGLPDLDDLSPPHRRTRVHSSHGARARAGAGTGHGIPEAAGRPGRSWLFTRAVARDGGARVVWPCHRRGRRRHGPRARRGGAGARRVRADAGADSPALDERARGERAVTGGRRVATGRAPAGDCDGRADRRVRARRGAIPRSPSDLHHRERSDGHRREVVRARRPRRRRLRRDGARWRWPLAARRSGP